eukprot:TRINITY_DN9316_c0_g2_i1.p1 TRINITY_DN9316_c0_g2~~TRINITY_DN9316_c0_g2_i1.p1  ORF type:complete len:308 (+),score=116.79 TRINITY_DN9316_c0_g2_i1:25-924(+)
MPSLSSTSAATTSTSPNINANISPLSLSSPPTSPRPAATSSWISSSSSLSSSPHTSPLSPTRSRYTPPAQSVSPAAAPDDDGDGGGDDLSLNVDESVALLSTLDSMSPRASILIPTTTFPSNPSSTTFINPAPVVSPSSPLPSRYNNTNNQTNNNNNNTPTSSSPTKADDVFDQYLDQGNTLLSSLGTALSPRNRHHPSPSVTSAAAMSALSELDDMYRFTPSTSNTSLSSSSSPSTYHSYSTATTYDDEIDSNIPTLGIAPPPPPPPGIDSAGVHVGDDVDASFDDVLDALTKISGGF